MSLLNTVRHFFQHPLGKQRPLTTLARFARWQLASRVGFGPIVVPFVEDAHLIVARGMTGATGSIYVGLHEFEDMAFVLHVLRPDDLFVDIGANIGSYTILAAKVVGAKCVSMEPLPSTFAHLENNVHYNRVGHLVEARNVGLAAAPGNLRFSANLDTMNHVVDDSFTGPTHRVEVLPLDDVLHGRVPLVMKIDVEGFERAVLSGASKTLASTDLQAVIIEVNDHQNRYDRSGKAPAEMLQDAGLHPFKYDPDHRRLTADDSGSPHGNIIYLRDLEFVQHRVASSRRYHAGPWSI